MRCEMAMDGHFSSTRNIHNKDWPNETEEPSDCRLDGTMDKAGVKGAPQVWITTKTMK
jgi:hypothetical protein